MNEYSTQFKYGNIMTSERIVRFAIALGLIVSVLAGYPQAITAVFGFVMVSIYSGLTAITGLDPLFALLDKMMYRDERLQASDSEVGMHA